MSDSSAPQPQQDLNLSSRVEVTAATFEEARDKAADLLGVLPEFLIPLSEPASVGDQVTVGFGYDTEQLASDGAAMCEALLERMEIRARVQILKRNGLPYLNISAGRNGQLVIGRNGQNIDAIQTIVNRMLVRCKSESNLLPVDCEDYLERHKQRLTGQAERAVRQVEETGQPVALPPMPPADRKMIHNLLAAYPHIATTSEGQALERHVVVLPQNTATGN